jgi:outer membrane protein TolC
LGTGLLAAGCAHLQSGRSIDEAVARSAADVWSGRLTAVPPEPAAPTPERADTGTPDRPMPLPALVDLGLRNNPATRIAWHQARAAAAQVGGAEAAWYPTVALDGQLQTLRQPATGGRPSSTLTGAGPAVSIAYLLLDLGGRSATVREAELALVAANLAHDAAVQQVLLSVEQAYYRYLAGKALTAAQQASMKEAQENRDAAEARRRSGIATVFDVLQAQTALSQAQLTLASLQGQAEIDRGALAMAVGLPATAPMEVGELPANVDLQRSDAEVTVLVRQAELQRPELAQARAAALQAQAHVQTVRSAGLPNLSLSGTAGRTYLIDSSSSYADAYNLTVLLRIPLFTGMRDTYALRQAEEVVQAAQAQAESTRNQIGFQVWQSWQTVQTAAQQMATGRALLQNAQASSEVAAGRYRAGVGSILDVTTAQAALASARAQEVQARAGWLLATATLAHDTGALLAELPGRSAPSQNEKRP